MSTFTEGQKVLVRMKKRSAGFRAKATVVKINRATVTVAIRWVGQKSGEVLVKNSNVNPQMIVAQSW